MEQLKNGSLRNTTDSTYYNVWKNFNQFLIKLDKMPKTWEDRLTLYCTYLIKIKNRKSSTIKSYVSGIKHVLKTDGYEWNDNQVLLNSLIKSCKLKNDKLKVRLPIQKGLLELILFKIQRKYENQPYLEAMYISAYLLQYYGLLRIGEIVQSNHTIQASNLHESKTSKKLLIVLYTSKTHGLDSPPQQIKIFGKRNIEINDERHTNLYILKKHELGKFCPVEWTKRYIQLRGPREPQSINDPLFRLSDKSPLQAAMLRNLLREIINGFNLDGQLYDTHSFRIGRATDLFKSNVSVDNIKHLGRWKSNAIYKYLRDL